MATDTAVVDAIFVHELRIVATPSQLRTLGARFEAARLVYNALLGEDLKRSQLVRESRDYQRARAMTDRKLRLLARQEGETPVQEARSVVEHRGPEPEARYLRYLDRKLIWRDLSLDLAIDANDQHTSHALACPIRRVRIVRRRIEGRDRYSDALVLGGNPYIKPRTSLGDYRIGVDPGPGVFGVAIGDWGALVDLRVAQDQQSNRRLERSIDRKLRRANPNNYAVDRNYLPGPHRWLKSNRLRHEYDRLREARRKEAALRKSARGHLVNGLLRFGSEVRVEANSFTFFRRVFGRSSNRA